MSALTPSNELKNKTNINIVENRLTEATAEDFIEIGAILDNHAELIDGLSTKTIEVTQTRNYQSTDHGNILFVMADATLIIEPSILQPDFICDVYTEVGTLTNAAVNGALTIPLSTSTLAIGKMQTVVRKGNTNVFLIKGENS